jgi:hypothetical protein
MKKLTLSLFALALVSLISSCKYEPSDGGGNTTTKVTPKTGSSYNYNRHEIDSTSSGKTTGDTAVSAVVISSDTTFAGKSHVVVLIDDYDTVRYTYESNGDVSFYRAGFGSSGFVFNNPTPWLTLPFGSKATGVTLFSTPQTIDYGGNQETVTVTGTADYIGTDQISVNGKTISSNQARLTITITGTSPAAVNIISTQTFSFDPSTIGYYFRQISNTIVNDIKIGPLVLLPGNSTFNEKTLLSYTLK